MCVPVLFYLTASIINEVSFVCYNYYVAANSLVKSIQSKNSKEAVKTQKILPPFSHPPPKGREGLAPPPLWGEGGVGCVAKVVD